MIVYAHASQQPVTPPWLDGFAPWPGTQVVHRDTALGHLVGVGDPIVFECPPARIFSDLDDGWRVALAGPLDPALIYRNPSWCRTAEVVDLLGRTWRAPIILDGDGERDFLVRYGGKDFLPVLSEEQARCEAMAQAARVAVPAGIEMGPEACRWAAVLLSATYAVPPEAIAALAILDAGLVIGCLAAATGLPLKHDPEAE